MTAGRKARERHTITSWQRGRFTAVLKGPVRVIHPVLKQLEVPWQWCYQVGAYTIPRQRVDDVLAAIENEGHRVDYRTALW